MTSTRPKPVITKIAVPGSGTNVYETRRVTFDTDGDWRNASPTPTPSRLTVTVSGPAVPVRKPSKLNGALSVLFV
jgi:hypothetical protein